MTMNDVELLSWGVHVGPTQGNPNATSMLFIDFVIEIKVFRRKRLGNYIMDHTNAGWILCQLNRLSDNFNPSARPEQMAIQRQNYIKLADSGIPLVRIYKFSFILISRMCCYVDGLR